MDNFDNFNPQNPPVNNFTTPESNFDFTTNQIGSDSYLNQTSFQPPQKPPKPQKPKKEKAKFSFWTLALSCVLSAALAVAGFYAILSANNYLLGEIDTKESDITSKASENINITIDETAESIAEAVSKKATKSVVGIRTTVAGHGFYSSESSGEGSGVIYSDEGYIITNYHVIENAASTSANSKIEVFLTDTSDEPYEATVIGYNISADIAVIKIDAKGLTPIDVADSDELSVGQYVITIGAPGGLEFMGSVTYGIISGLDREITTDSDIALIQTDAAINPGNSGGALLNTKGELVGINSAKIASVEFEGMGFAIPSNAAIELTKNIIKNQNKPEPYLGVTVSETYTPEMLESYGFPRGAVISSVATDSPAEKAGIMRGDIITEFDGKEITTYSKLRDYVADSQPGDKVKIELYRNGKTYTVNVTIGSNNQMR